MTTAVHMIQSMSQEKYMESPSCMKHKGLNLRICKTFLITTKFKNLYDLHSKKG